MAAGGLLGTLALVLGTACATSGCSSLSYYAQAAGGHFDLMRRARSVAEVVADPATPAPLRERLQLSQRMRDFAVSELRLPDNRSYRRYADLEREAVVWNVAAAPELSLTLKTWCFPVMGCVGYRGSFQRAGADDLAAERRRADFRALTQRYRAELLALYQGAGDTPAKIAGKARLMLALRADYQALKQGPWQGFAGYDGWFERANNASFGVLAAYTELVPEFERLFEAQGADFDRFYASVRELAALPKDQRRARLAGTAQ